MTVVGTTPANLTTQVVATLDRLDGQIVLLGIGDGPTGPPTVPIIFTLATTGAPFHTHRDARYNVAFSSREMAVSGSRETRCRKPVDRRATYSPG